MLQQLALGMDVSASALQPHKQPTPPPLPPGVLEEAGAGPGRVQRQQTEAARPTTSAETVQPRAAMSHVAMAAAPTAECCSAGRQPGGPSGFVVQRNALREQVSCLLLLTHSVRLQQSVLGTCLVMDVQHRDLRLQL
jgi:hypothetical protein